MLEEKLRMGLIVFQVLELEKDAGANESHQSQLSDLITTAIGEIGKVVRLNGQHNHRYTEEEAVAISKTMTNIFHNYGFRDEGIHVLFHQGLENRIVNCVVPTIIRLSIAEMIGLNLEGVTAPESHLFTRWTLNGSYFNWEPMGTEQKDDNYYIRKYNIPHQSIHNGVFLRAIKREEIMAIAHNQIGVAYIQQDNPDKAIENLMQSVQLKPDYPEAYNNIGIALIRMGHHRSAIERFNRALSLNPNYHEALTNRGDVFFSLGEDALAFRDYETSITLNGEFPNAYRGLGQVLIRAGEYYKAIEFLNNALSLDPSYSRAYLYRGIARGMAGDLSVSYDDLTRAVELDPRNIMANDLRRAVLLQLNNHKK